MAQFRLVDRPIGELGDDSRRFPTIRQKLIDLQARRLTSAMNRVRSARVIHETGPSVKEQRNPGCNIGSKRHIDRKAALRTQELGPHYDAADGDGYLLSEKFQKYLDPFPNPGMHAVTPSAGQQLSGMKIADGNDDRKLRIIPAQGQTPVQEIRRDPVIVGKKYDILALCGSKAGVPVRKQTNISLLPYDTKSGIRECLEHPPGIISRRIVGYEYLDVRVTLRERTFQAALQKTASVEGGYCYSD
nr:hypothetical protein [Bradyrhizobium guangdongense]